MAKPVMRKVVKVLGSKAKTIRTRATRNTMDFKFVTVIRYELECGHTVARESESSTPSTRLKCGPCSSEVHRD